MKEPITWWRAQVVKAIAEPLIDEFHQHLEEVTILYVFRSKHTAYLAFPTTELESLVDHELSHIRRGDALWDRGTLE